MPNIITNKQEAEKIIRASKMRNRFKGSIKANPTNQKPCFSGKNERLKNVTIEYNPDYPLHKTPYEDSFGSVLEAVVEHEITHKDDANGRGCPKNEELDLNNILIPISRVLKNKGFPNIPFGTQGHTLYTYYANLFEDFVVNNIVSDNNGSKGIFLLYDDFAQHSGKFNELFEGFMKLQAMTFPQKQGTSLMLRHFEQSEKAREAVKNYLSRTGIKDVPIKQRVNFLENSDNWKNLSEIFADEFSKLIDLKNLAYFYFPLFAGNDFSRLNEEEIQMELALKAYGEKGGKFEPPPFLEDNLVLLSLYKRLAKNIEIKVESYSIETEMPVSHVSKRRFDFQNDSVENLEFGVNEKGEIEAQIGKYPLNIKSRYQISVGSFPEVRIGLLDCSGSTQCSINGKQGKIMNPWAQEEHQWTDTSIYHHELMCFFGLCELFRRRGTLRNSNVRLGVFSNKTRIAKDLSESEKLALQPSFGGTRFDETAMEIFKGRGSLVYTISDGEVENWSSKKDKYIEGAKRHHYFHLQIGRESQMYKDLKAEGLNAILDNGQDSAQILVDLTQNQVYKTK